jgi:hypothetical protein
MGQFVFQVGVTGQIDPNPLKIGALRKKRTPDKPIHGVACNANSLTDGQSLDLIIFSTGNYLFSERDKVRMLRTLGMQRPCGEAGVFGASVLLGADRPLGQCQPPLHSAASQATIESGGCVPGARGSGYTRVSPQSGHRTSSCTGSCVDTRNARWQARHCTVCWYMQSPAGFLAPRRRQFRGGTISNRRIFRQSVVRSIFNRAAARPRFQRLASSARSSSSFSLVAGRAARDR